MPRCRSVEDAGTFLSKSEVTPIWQADWQLPVADHIPATLLDWLLEPGSLTARLKNTGHAFQLQLVQQDMVTLPAFLQQRWASTTGLLREVVLCLEQRPCIYAQSFIPASTVEVLQPLANLGEMPLGHYIFTQPQLSRSPIELAFFPAGLMLPGLGAQPGLWSRRSYFTLSQHELLVQELYLPALTEFI